MLCGLLCRTDHLLWLLLGSGSNSLGKPNRPALLPFVLCSGCKINAPLMMLTESQSPCNRLESRVHPLASSSSSVFTLFGHCQCPETHLHRTVNCDRYLLTNCGWQQHHRSTSAPPQWYHQIRFVRRRHSAYVKKLGTGLGCNSFIPLHRAHWLARKVV